MKEKYFCLIRFYDNMHVSENINFKLLYNGLERYTNLKRMSNNKDIGFFFLKLLLLYTFAYSEMRIRDSSWLLARLWDFRLVYIYE